MNELDKTLNDVFPGFVVRKDLAGEVKGSSQVPTYVLEYLLAQYAASDDEAIIRQGTEDVRAILSEHYVDPANAQLVRSRILERGRYKVIDKVTVRVNEKNQTYEAHFQNLNLSGVEVDSYTVTQNEKLLVGGVWCLVDLEHYGGQNPNLGSPWVMGGLKPIQMSNFNMDAYLEGRARFDSEQWLDVLVQSIGLDPSFFTTRGKLLQLTRLIPYVENNYNLVELGPKGTGKSHIYTEFSPHGMLVSGGEVTVPKLFVNNATRQVGLVGYWDVVAFDEFAGQGKRVDKALVDIMKNYMANRSFSRGTDIHTASASMAFIGNTSSTVPYMLKNTDLFQDLPDAYHDSAYLDRVHFYLPGWEIDPIRGELFTTGYGFVVDYLAEAFKALRKQDYSNRYREHFTLDPQISTRDREAIHKTFSGLMKLLHPSGEATKDEIEELLRFAVEGRKRVKDQIVRIDPTMHEVPFAYKDASGSETFITTLEEDEYPEYYSKVAADEADAPSNEAKHGEVRETAGGPVEPLQPAQESAGEARAAGEAQTPFTAWEGPARIKENQSGVTYEKLFGPWLKGAREITLTDPYIRKFHQAKNLMEFIQMLTTLKSQADTVDLILVTGEETGSEEWRRKQLEFLAQVQNAAALGGVNLTVEFKEGLHDRSIETDTGWRIGFGRGLDIFQPYEGGSLNLQSRLQEFRRSKEFDIFYVRERKS